jgi:hypothetical protein
MKLLEILEAVDEVLTLSLGGDEGNEATAMRAELAAERHPEFLEAYPKLACMCCQATTAERAEGVRRFLTLMIEQMRGIDAGSATFEDASKNVGVALGEHFLPPRDPPTS